MARTPSQYIEVSGPLFEPDVLERFNRAVTEGLVELGDEASGILAGFVQQSGFVKTGAFIRSIDSQLKGDPLGIGYVVVAPTDVWPMHDRPTRTWYEQGRRKGVKLRKASGGFSKTRRRIRTMTYPKIEAKIQAVLE